MDAVAEIEDAFVAQWEYFGRWPKGELHSENGLVWFETPIKHLPYNGVIRTQAAGVRTEHSIADLVERFRSRQVDFVWIDHPSAIPSDLGSQLLSAGLEPVERMTGMALDLDSYAEHTAGAACRVEEVKDESELDTYTALALAYWEITDKHDGELISELHRHWGPGKAPGHRFMAHREGAPVGKGFLSLAGPSGVAGIYGMSVVKTARGLGVAAALTSAMLQKAKEAGCSRVVLHSSDMAQGLYRRFGFKEQCHLTAYATASIWSGDH